jgi:AcrR family transcriptional regulator
MARGVGLTTQGVIDAAAALVDTHGVEALTITHIAAACGVRAPSLYKHVADLDEVRAALTLRAYAALADALHATSDADPTRAVLAVGRAWRAWAKAHPGVYLIASRTHVRGDARVFAAGAKVVACMLDRVRALGVGDERALHLTRALRACIHGFVLLELSDGFGLAGDVDASFDVALRALIAAARDQA